MSLPNLPTEIILHIFRDCSSISSAINLSLTCRRFHHLLRTSQKIPVLFAIAERAWGPLEDIYQILTYNAAQPVHVKRSPALSFVLLVQVSRIGRVAKWFQDMYIKTRWDGDKAHLRRELTLTESHALRRAIYRMWLYSIAFHTSTTTRMQRINAGLVANRCQLLRLWSTDELIELEDVRHCLENVLADICPSNGEVFWRSGTDAWPRDQKHPHRVSVSSTFHDAHHVDLDEPFTQLPAHQLREQMMEGWGDEIEQYHALSSLMKLNPSQIKTLYENVTSKREVEKYVDERAGGGMWFWDNGETMLHSWMVVLHSRGLPVQELREKICCGLVGVAVDDFVGFLCEL